MEIFIHSLQIKLFQIYYLYVKRNVQIASLCVLPLLTNYEYKKTELCVAKGTEKTKYMCIVIQFVLVIR